MTVSLPGNESELLAKIAKGDERAFKIIFDTYHHKIFLYALRYMKSEPEAEEVAQEVFLKLWMRDPNALPLKSLDGYFHTLVRNRSLDILRRKALENHIDLERAVNWEEAHNDTQELIMLNDTRKILEEGINLLSPQQKLVYQLCHQEGLKYTEAAQALHLSPGTVHTHMKLALKFLRNYLQQRTDIAAFIVIFRLLQ